MIISTFLIYCFIITFSPGPTHLITLSTVQYYGVKKAINFCYGASVAFIIILILALTLNSILASLIPKAIIIMQIIGSSYILYLAYQIFITGNSSKERKDFGSFKTGFLMQFLNPKVILFCITIYPSFIMPYYSSFHELIIFTVIISIIGSISFFSWIIFGSILKSLLQKYQKFTNTLLSLFLVYCAIIISGITDL